MGIKDRRTKILLALALMSNETFVSVTFSSDICDVFDLTLNRKTKQTFAELVQEGLITEVSNGEIPVFTLTPEGHNDIILNFPVFRFSKEKWDGLFRILSYEIPEKKRELRDKFRREVASWGLGPWHRSFWLTPHPIITSLRKLVSEKEEEQYIQAFESTHVFGDRELLIEKVWGKKKLEAQYRNLFKKWHQILSKDQDKVAKMKQVVTDYVDILKQDPGLPKQLIGDNWIGNEAVTLFREIRDILLTSK